MVDQLTAFFNNISLSMIHCLPKNQSQVVPCLLFALFCSFAILFGGCQKTGTEPIAQLATFQDSASLWFSNLPPAKYLPGVPDWGSSKLITRKNGKTYLEVPIKITGQIWTTPRFGVTGKVKMNTYSNIIIYKENGEFKAFIMQLSQLAGKSGYVSYAKLPGNWSGEILYTNLNGALQSGWVYQDGKPTQQIRRPLPNSDLARYECVTLTIDYYQTVSVGSYTAAPTYLYSRSYTTCSYVDPSNPGHYEEEPIDYKQDPGGGGGYTGDPITIDVQETKIIKFDSSLSTKYPCAVTLIQAMLRIEEFQAMSNPFNQDLRPNLTWAASSQVWDAATGQYQLGTASTGEGSNTSAVIRFNTKGLENASELMVAAAAIHEMFHAYANYYIEWKAIGGVPAQSWASAVADAVQLQRVGNANARDHAVMMGEVFNHMENVLNAWAGNRYTYKDQVMALMFGLTTVALNGAQADPAAQQRLNDAFNLLKNERGITDAELQQFNINNVTTTPAGKKLPASGC